MREKIKSSMSRKNIIKLTMIVLFPIIVFLFSQSIEDIGNENRILLTLIITCVVFWATNIIPNYLTSIVFLFCCSSFSLASNDVIFSGFSSLGFWLILSAMILANAVKNSNFIEKLASYIKIEKFNYFKILTFIGIFGVILSFLIPSATSRVLLYTPIAISIALLFGYSAGSKGYNGIIISAILCTYLPAFGILTSNLPNIILNGLSEKIYGEELLYSTYFLANFLVLGFLKTFVIIFSIFLFFKEEPKIFPKLPRDRSFSKHQKILLFTLLTMVFFWMTDFYHHINSTYIAVAGVVFLALPGIKIIRLKDLNNLSFSILLLIATLISFGNVISNNIFIQESLEKLLNLYDFQNHSVFVNYMFIACSAVISSVFLTQVTVPSIFTPLAGEISELTDFSLFEVLMIYVAGFSTIFFPFQAPPVIAGMHIGKIKVYHLTKILFLIAFLTIFILYPLNYLWMNFLK